MGLFGDYRFNFGNAYNAERVRILDVMLTIGINYSVPRSKNFNRKKTFDIGEKVYKWTKKGAR
jgi:hypothetical protein